MTTRIDGTEVARREKQDLDRLLAYSTYAHEVEIVSQEFVLDKVEQITMGDATFEDRLKFIDYNCGTQAKAVEIEVHYTVGQETEWTISGEYEFGEEIEVALGSGGAGGKSTSSYSFKVGGSTSGKSTSEIEVVYKSTVTIPPKTAALAKLHIARTPAQGRFSGKVRVIYWHQYKINDANALDFFNSDSRSLRVKKYRDFPVILEFETQLITGLGGNQEVDIDCDDPLNSLREAGYLESGLDLGGLKTVPRPVDKPDSTVAPVPSGSHGYLPGRPKEARPGAAGGEEFAALLGYAGADDRLLARLLRKGLEATIRESEG